MGDWTKVEVSGSNAKLQSLYLSGTEDLIEQYNPLYAGGAQDLHLHDLSGTNNDWKTNSDNSNTTGTPWISTNRSVYISSFIGSKDHLKFDVRDLSPESIPTTIVAAPSPEPGEVIVQSNSTIFMDGFQNSIDYTAYFDALVAATSGWGSYTLTDGTSTASYQITDVQGFSNDNYKILGSYSGTSIMSLNTGAATISLPGMYLTPTPDTGPDDGFVLTDTSSTSKNEAQSSGAKYLYAETSDAGENIYSITSPYLDLTSYATKKLVFYFHLYGVNSGQFKVYTCPSSSSLEDRTITNMKYSSWAGVNGLSPSSTVFADAYWSGGINNTPTTVTSISGPIQATGSSPWNRVEVDLTTLSTGFNEVFNTGYIWIVYESGIDPFVDVEPSEADFGICNLFLDLDGYNVPQYLYHTAPTLGVLGTAIKFHGLPTSDPGQVGALYKDPTTLDDQASPILISNGP
tara:strand:- start:1675 stop:3051 length:1377 start_codon:yes stop_codon:yes gene_type:complete